MAHPALVEYIEQVVRTYADEDGWSAQRRWDELMAARETMRRHPDHRTAPGEVGTRVYIIMDKRGPFKVGVSNNPEYRLHTLQAGNPGDLGVVYQTRPYSRAYAMAVEAAVHDRLAAVSLGREWFSGTIDQAIEAVHLCGGLAE